MSNFFGHFLGAFEKLRGPFVVAFFELFARSVAIEFGGHADIGNCGSVPIFILELLVNFFVNLDVKTGSWGSGSTRS